MTHILKVKVLQLPRHMYQVNPAYLKHLLKNKRRARKKLKQNQTQTLTIQTLKTQMKKQRRREGQPKKRNLPRKLYPNPLRHQKWLLLYKRRSRNQFSLLYNKFNQVQSLKLILCSIFSLVYRLKYSSIPSSQFQLQISDLCNQINNKFSNNSLRTHNLAESDFCHKRNKCNNHRSTLLEILESLFNSSLTKIILVPLP